MISGILMMFFIQQTALEKWHTNMLWETTKC